MLQPIPGDSIDPRDPLSTLKRMDLIKIVQHYSLPIDVDSPAEILRTVIRQAQETKKIRFTIRPPRNRLADVRGILVLPQVNKTDFSQLDRFALMRMCKQKGIPASNRDKRQDLIEKLNG